ncbi:LEUCINE-RICH REPEAT-CONTAINING PROTEIN [Salix purpurea]|uniref:LEUCINE-RICH REPEAT-CONTAINING PROTEIN n=1 Tax=Salix purpurea TaxID=77065 RepID=A0A9Q0URB1_SALPP|nr:LEUCINE-RICH REPEAT-CONTAINING PROTEIN [Salix purpurea]
MSKLRLLKINNVLLFEGPEDLSNNLRFLEWHFYPSKSLPAGLQVDELVELHMPNSHIEQLWYGYKVLPCEADCISVRVVTLEPSCETQFNVMTGIHVDVSWDFGRTLLIMSYKLANLAQESKD